MKIFTLLALMTVAFAADQEDKYDYVTRSRQLYQLAVIDNGIGGALRQVITLSNITGKQTEVFYELASSEINSKLNITLTALRDSKMTEIMSFHVTHEDLVAVPALVKFSAENPEYKIDQSVLKELVIIRNTLIGKLD